MKLWDDTFRARLATVARERGLTVEDVLAMDASAVLRLKGIGRKAMRRIYGPEWQQQIPAPKRLWTSSPPTPKCRTCTQNPSVVLWFREHNDGIFHRAQRVGLFCDKCAKRGQDFLAFLIKSQGDRYVAEMLRGRA